MLSFWTLELQYVNLLDCKSMLFIFLLFETDLQSISSEIQTLQEQSMTMNVKLKNRQVCFPFSSLKHIVLL